jgi:hypothetical protein
MHSFTDLVERSASFTLARLREANEQVTAALQTSGAPLSSRPVR